MCRLPAAGTAEALGVRFDRPLDRALLQHALEVSDGAGRPVPGRPEIGAAERSWTFTPAEPWLAGEYRLAIDPRLEDHAGNSLARVFDRDLGRDEAPAGSGDATGSRSRCKARPHRHRSRAADSLVRERGLLG